MSRSNFFTSPIENKDHGKGVRLVCKDCGFVTDVFNLPRGSVKVYCWGKIKGDPDRVCLNEIEIVNKTA